MLGHNSYYHEHTKKYVSIFGTLFNDITIVRKGKTETKTIKVPLSYAHKDKALQKLLQDPELRNTWDILLPRMSFFFNTMTYAPNRKTNSANWVMRKENGDQDANFQYSPAPYDFSFTLSIWAQYYEDGLQIVEQILPFFQPEFTVAVKEIPNLGIERDVHIVLNSVSFSDDVEGDFETQRIIQWDLEFTVQGFLFGPTLNKGVIKKAFIETFFDPNMEEFEIREVVEVIPEEANKTDPHEIKVTRIERNV